MQGLDVTRDASIEDPIDLSLALFDSVEDF